MTQEEAYEYDQLVSRYNSLVSENNCLREEIAVGISNCFVVAGNMATVGRAATNNIKYVSNEVSQARDTVQSLYDLLLDITTHYFLFKNMSEASKKLTQYTDEYYTKFQFYNELRRITLGYVIGIDSHIVNSETLRKKVEKAYLANTDYWLAYAISAVMLWASDEKEAAYRALNKSLTMDANRTCVFFMLVNIRFGRMEVGKNWFLTFLDKTDVNNVPPEWQHVLRAYLIGAMKNDEQFESIANGYFDKMLDQTQGTNAGFNKKIHDRAYQYASSYIHLTDRQFANLKELCPDYESMLGILSAMEKIAVIAKHYDEISEMEDDAANNIYEHIENVLYDLINGYDDKELEIVKGMFLNEAILAAKGNLDIANTRFAERYGSGDQRRTFGDLMIHWAFDEDYRATDISVKRFSLSHLKDRISKGMTGYFEDQKQLLCEKYKFSFGASEEIPGIEVECDENGYDSAAQKISLHYSQNKLKFILNDKMFKILALVCAGALMILALAGMVVHSGAFPVLLTLGIVGGIAGGFLLWRRWVDLGQALSEKCRLTLVRLRNVLEELGSWKKLVNRCYDDLGDLQNAIERF